MKPRLVIAAALLLAGCESDAEKLQKLRTAEILAHGHMVVFKDTLDAMYGPGWVNLRDYTEPHTKALLDSFRTASIEHDLAQRDLDRFMR